MPTAKSRYVCVDENPLTLFISGFKLNTPWQFWKLRRLRQAQRLVLQELQSKSDLGFLGFEHWYGNPDVIIQYWRSYDELMDYARNKDAKHFPAWVSFNASISVDAGIGLWHEIYQIEKGQMSALYRNMSPIGLGKFRGCKQLF